MVVEVVVVVVVVVEVAAGEGCEEGRPHTSGGPGGVECAKLCIVLTADLSAVCTLCTNLGHPTVKFNRFPGLARRRPLLIKVAPSTMERILASPMATN